MKGITWIPRYGLKIDFPSHFSLAVCWVIWDLFCNILNGFVILKDYLFSVIYYSFLKYYLREDMFCICLKGGKFQAVNVIKKYQNSIIGNIDIKYSLDFLIAPKWILFANINASSEIKYFTSCIRADTVTRRHGNDREALSAWDNIYIFYLHLNKLSK